MAHGARSRIVAVSAALFAFVAAACGPSTPPTPPPGPTVERATALPPPRADGRLPALATPTGYELEVEVDANRPTFRGRARIAVQIPARTSHVVLHAHALEIPKAVAIVDGDPTERRAKVSSRYAHGGKPPHPEELVLTFEPALPAGSATLVLDYEGPFDDALAGLYRTTADGKSYAFTKFEPTFARRAFPCFDEPAHKVPFTLSITVPRGSIAVANTDETSRLEQGDKTTFRFAPTAPLPTYLVAFATGELDVRELARGKTPRVRIITTKGRTTNGELALTTTAELVDALGDWFGVPYPYGKLDVVAVPDFSAGAMENPGLITFREELLLLDPARASVRARRSQALVVAHELAHQWFGNLVTAAWWDDLWLNEGFATWMEAKIVDTWRPGFATGLDAVASAHGVMDVDGLVSARAVRQPVRTTGEALEAFDGITYQKGAAVLSLVERWIGEAAFKRGVREYLTTNAHKSVAAGRLFDALDRAAGRSVTEMASTFLDHAGVPSVSLQMECERGGRWHAEVSQEPWRPLGSAAAHEGGPEEAPAEHAWTLPVCVLAQGEKSATCADLAFGAPSLVAGRGCPAWIHPNAAASYYRFTLTEAELAKLAAARAQLDVPQRIALVSNAWASVRTGKLEARALAKALPAFDDETSRQVVDQVIAVLAGMSQDLVTDEARPSFERYVQARLAKRKRALGWTPKPEEAAGSGDAAMLRRSVLWALGELGADETTLREAEEHAARWLADPTSVDADTAAVALDLASRRAGPERFDALVRASLRAPTNEDRLLALRATLGFDDPKLLERALERVLGDEIRTQDARYVIASAFARRRTRPIFEGFVRARWEDLRKRYHGSQALRFLSAASIGCSKEELAAQRAFYAPRGEAIDGSERLLASAFEGVSLCAELRAHGASSLSRELTNIDAKSRP